MALSKLNRLFSFTLSLIMIVELFSFNAMAITPEEQAQVDQMRAHGQKLAKREKIAMGAAGLGAIGVAAAAGLYGYYMGTTAGSNDVSDSLANFQTFTNALIGMTAVGSTFLIGGVLSLIYFSDQKAKNNRAIHNIVNHSTVDAGKEQAEKVPWNPALFKDMTEQEKADLEKACGICLDDFTQHSEITGKGIKLHCFDEHHFHEMCVKQWYDTKGTCPLCKQVVLNLEETQARKAAAEEARRLAAASRGSQGSEVEMVPVQAINDGNEAPQRPATDVAIDVRDVEVVGSGAHSGN